jgi:hypothetical protein
MIIKVYEILSESLLHKSTILMSSKSEVANQTSEEVNIRPINSEVALPQCYA